ncbi:MAG TPA: hypothetical protein EYN60_06585, partial [Nitrospirales bacterium]|nr:hypothetical protein [Nitrospirales bacterium]
GRSIIIIIPECHGNHTRLCAVQHCSARRNAHYHFLKVPDSEELIELCSFPASGAVQVQEDLVHLAFEVEDMDHTIQELNSKGIPITDGPTTSSSGSRFIFIDAPDGYEIELIQRLPGTVIV